MAPVQWLALVTINVAQFSIAILTIIVAQTAGAAGYSWAFSFNAAMAIAGVLVAVTAPRCSR
ncbi:hypothetical protein [Nesterenkonia aerolata]|uniref:Major facilitator superfamily (MFS) profile domain-containing protein n=1 Tax=Nesterenkonia aerolata TaxID=3074079 RepID=A0ABU2DQP4_9MICC|nr:hypothetical protein [Nesterenkonia sp. LY-0111]MDR8018827.1 hypothetical protein [Nesterenkonia sp. LY-0111]